MMLSAREWFRRWIEEAEPSTRELLCELTKNADLLGEPDVKLDFIIGGPWPSAMPHAISVACQYCGTQVGLTPESGSRAARRFPQARIACLNCVIKTIKELN